jgi:xanthine dehydrogenase accessory factor
MCYRAGRQTPRPRSELPSRGAIRAGAKHSPMLDVLDTVERWRSGGQRVALATVVGVEKSAPRDAGATMAVNERGEVAGSVSGGCVEAAVYEEAQDAIAGGRARLVTYGISDAQAIEHGLTCGGTIHVFVERLDW